MRLTTKGRYAVTAMLDLAMHADSGPVSLNDISGRQSISLSYLEQLFSKLRRNGLVLSVRGPGGGYYLNRDSQLINISQIVDAVSESIDATRCQGKADCSDGVECLTHHLWRDLSDHIQNFLTDISLYDLVCRKEIKVVAERQNDRDSSLIDKSTLNDIDAQDNAINLSVLL